jgi:hypothetical protein
LTVGAVGLELTTLAVWLFARRQARCQCRFARYCTSALNCRSLSRSANEGIRGVRVLRGRLADDAFERRGIKPAADIGQIRSALAARA